MGNPSDDSKRFRSVLSRSLGDFPMAAFSMAANQHLSAVLDHAQTVGRVSWALNDLGLGRRCPVSRDKSAMVVGLPNGVGMRVETIAANLIEVQATHMGEPYLWNGQAEGDDFSRALVSWENPEQGHERLCNIIAKINGLKPEIPGM